MIYELLRITTEQPGLNHPIEIDVARSWLPPVAEVHVTYSYLHPSVGPGMVAVLNTVSRRLIKISLAQYEAIKAGQAVTVFAPQWPDGEWWLILTVAAGVYGAGLGRASALIAGVGTVLLLAHLGLTLVAGWLSTIADERFLLRWLVLLVGSGAVIIPVLPLAASMPKPLLLAGLVAVLGAVLCLAGSGMLHFALNAASERFARKGAQREGSQL